MQPRGSVNTTDFTILAANFNKTGQNWLGGISMATVA